MKASFLDAAADEYAAAAEYYELREAGLGGQFLAEVDSAMALALEFPSAGSPVSLAGAEQQARSLVLRTFPAKLVYAVRGDSLVIIAIAHTSRLPGYWRRRLAGD